MLLSGKLVWRVLLPGALTCLGGLTCLRATLSGVLTLLFWLLVDLLVLFGLGLQRGGALTLIACSEIWRS